MLVEDITISHILFGYFSNFSYVREDHMILVPSEDTSPIWQVRIHARVIHEVADQDVKTAHI